MTHDEILTLCQFNEAVPIRGLLKVLFVFVITDVEVWPAQSFCGLLDEIAAFEVCKIRIVITDDDLVVLFGGLLGFLFECFQ